MPVSKSTEGGAERSPFQKFEALTRAAIAVPKAEIDKREAEYQKQRKAKKSKD
jgi:hypothetical protein